MDCITLSVTEHQMPRISRLTFIAGISSEGESCSVFKPTPYLIETNEAIAKPMDQI